MELSIDQQIVQQLIQALDNDIVHLDKVPALQRLIKDSAEQQMARLYNTTDFHAKQKAALADEQAWYHQKINQIVADTASQLNTEQIEQAVKADITQQRQQLSRQIRHLKHMQAKLERQQKFWISIVWLALPVMVTLLKCRTVSVKEGANDN